MAPTIFNRRLRNGKTFPAVITCEDASPPVEAVAKLSAGCERGVTSLAIEMVSALLAGDLQVPLPEPLFLEFTGDVLDAIPDREWAALAARSSRLAFGSKLLPSAYSAWTMGAVLVESMADDAAATLLFDVAIENPDRRAVNPNCLVRGDAFRVFDHELAFPPLLIGARPVWEAGSLHHLTTPGMHIFRDALMRRDIDWSPHVARWKGLSDRHLDDYGACLPQEWAEARAAVSAAIEKIKKVRDNIDACVVEVQRVLS